MDHDYGSLQAAVDAAAGKTLVLTASHRLSVAVNVGGATRSPVHIMAMPGVVITQTGDGQDGFRIGSDDCILDGLTIVFECTNTSSNCQSGSGIRALAGVRRPIIRGCKVVNWRYGYTFNGVKGGRIEGCWAWGGSADGAASSDFFLYAESGNPNDRIDVEGCFALSNNDNGFSIATNSGERNVHIRGCLAVPCDPTGTTELAEGDVRRRYGFVMGYNGNSEILSTVTGCEARLCAYAGFYSQGGALPAGTVAWSNLVASRCGFGTFFPQDSSLRAGFLIISGGADTWTGLVAADCHHAGIKFCPDFGYSNTNGMRASFSAITIARTEGYGIWCTNKPAHAVFTGYTITGSRDAAVYIEANSHDAGGIVFGDGRVEVNGAKGGFQVSATVGGIDFNQPVTIAGAIEIVGDGDPTDNEFNSGIWCEGNVRVRGASIKGFHRGVNVREVTAGRRIDRVFESLVLEDCAFGFNAAGTGTLLATQSVFRNCATKTYGAFVVGSLIGEAIHFQTGTLPASGVWAQGDIGWNPSPTIGTPYQYVCVASGSPGTWISKI
ncbi:hypothetical protein HHL28_17485 [Aerophototrophica crusticola]|uniref:Right handed beta helix domain-containing protein n=1 Tax=Aerophototrophica crusticola TaxID=1709002 RepID=A0A858RC13_9PROT|nr:hypothetical protein HHL28_17485 [Rhodospirillaceae bacterium B3]